jgi:hypothetical protein
VVKMVSTTFTPLVVFMIELSLMALTQALNWPDGLYRDIFLCSKGLATFGTPHRGSEYATLAATITRVMNFLCDTPRTPYIELLQEESTILDIIGELFLRDYRYDIWITSFYCRMVPISTRNSSIGQSHAEIDV